MFPVNPNTKADTDIDDEGRAELREDLIISELFSCRAGEHPLIKRSVQEEFTAGVHAELWNWLFSASQYCPGPLL